MFLFLPVGESPANLLQEIIMWRWYRDVWCVAHVNADLAAPGTQWGWCNAQNPISFWEAGEGRVEGLGWRQEGLVQLQTLKFYIVRHWGKRLMPMRDQGGLWPVWSLWASSLLLHARAHYPKTPDGRWWYNFQSYEDVLVYAGCRRWEKELLCRKCNVIWRNILLGHFSWPFHCRSIFSTHQGTPYGWRFFLRFFPFFFFLEGGKLVGELSSVRP